MLIQEEYVRVLAELGLTHLQAKVYVSLVCLKSATARDIHRYSNVARQDVYRILSELEEKNLIERIIAKPTKFRPVPPNDATSILLQRRKEKNRQLQKKVIRVFRNFQNNNIKTSPLDRGCQFILLSKSKTNSTASIDSLRDAVDNAQTSVIGLLTFQLFMKVKYRDEQIWKKTVKKGVKYRMIIGGRPEKRKIKLALDPALKNTDYFEIRWIRTPSPVCVLLVDESKAFCRMGLDLESRVLFSMTPCFVAMVKDYFEMKWSTEIESKTE